MVRFAKLFAVAMALAVVITTAQARPDKEEKTLKGTITCAKCDLAKETTCMTVIVAKDKDKKDVTYYFDTAGSKKYHGKVCTEAKPGSVTGVVATKDDKKIITVSKVEFDK